MRRLTFIVILVAFIFSCGGQWPFLQAVAWANMIRQYSEIVPFSHAVQMTFSGHYPCPLCRAIAGKKQSEDNKIAILFQHEKKLSFPAFIVEAPRMIASPRTFEVREKSLPTRSEAPPTPPPRFA